MKRSYECAVMGCGVDDAENEKWFCVCENDHWMHQHCLTRLFESKVIPTCPLCNDDTLGRVRDIVLWTEHKADQGDVNRIDNEGYTEEERATLEEDEEEEEALLRQEVKWLRTERDALRELANAYGWNAMLSRVATDLDPQHAPPCCRTVRVMRLWQINRASQQIIDCYANYVRKLWQSEPGYANMPHQVEAEEEEDEEEEETITDPERAKRVEATLAELTDLTDAMRKDMEEEYVPTPTPSPPPPPEGHRLRSGRQILPTETSTTTRRSRRRIPARS